MKTYHVKIETKTNPKENILSPKDIKNLYHAKIADMDINMDKHNIGQHFSRFNDYIHKSCFNRKLALIDDGLGVKSSKIIQDILSKNEEIS